MRDGLTACETTSRERKRDCRRSGRRRAHLSDFHRKSVCLFSLSTSALSSEATRESPSSAATRLELQVSFPTLQLLSLPGAIPSRTSLCHMSNTPPVASWAPQGLSPDRALHEMATCHAGMFLHDLRHPPVMTAANLEEWRHWSTRLHVTSVRGFPPSLAPPLMSCSRSCAV